MEENKWDTFLKKLQEPSTVKGLLVIAALLGAKIEPTLQDQILVGAAAAYGLIQVFIVKG